MYVGPTSVLGTSLRRLPFTGFSAAGYILLALGLLVTGLLLARIGQSSAGGSGGRAQVTRLIRWSVFAAVFTAGVLLLVFASWWRGIETWASAHTIGLATTHTTIPVTKAGVVVLTHASGPPSLFGLSSECSVAQILGAVLIGGAPLVLVRRLGVGRVLSALGMAGLVLVVVNVLRLTAIGVAISSWGQDGFAVAHTYLGSLLTFIGTCLAGVAFAAALLVRRRPVNAPKTTG